MVGSGQVMFAKLGEDYLEYLLLFPPFHSIHHLNYTPDSRWAERSAQDTGIPELHDYILTGCLKSEITQPPCGSDPQQYEHHIVVALKDTGIAHGSYTAH